MNLQKSNIALLIVTVALAVPTTIQIVSESESFVDYSRVPFMFDGFTEDNVGSILLAHPKAEQPQPNPQNPDQKVAVAYDQLLIQRTDKGWAVGQAMGIGMQPNDLAGAPVSAQRVEMDVFEHLKKIRVDKQSLIQPGATPEQLEEYGLDEKHATLIRVSDKTGASVVAGLYVGNDAAGKLTGTEAVRGVFVRKADSNDVVLYEFDKGWRRDVATDQWIDRVLLKLAPETVTRISLSNASTGGKPIAFKREDNKASWVAEATPEGRGAVRQTEIEGILGRLRWISIQEFKLPMQRVGNLAEMGLLPPQIELEISWKEGDAERTAKFQVGNRVEGDQNVHYLTSTEAPFLMTWPAGMVTALEVDVPATWFDPAGPAPGTGDGDAVKKDPADQNPDKSGQGNGGKKD